MAIDRGVQVPSTARLATRFLIGSPDPIGERWGADSTRPRPTLRHVAYDPPRHSLAVARATL
jgi:hypothetical protein